MEPLNDFINQNELPPILALLEERDQLIDTQISGLNINQLRNDSDFESAITTIENTALLDRVFIGEPLILARGNQNIPINVEQELLGDNGSRNIFTISFPFSGNAQVFQHRPPSPIPMTNKDRGILRQIGNDEVSVRVRSLSSENPNDADVRRAAVSFFAATRKLVEANNRSIAVWRINARDRIRKMADRRRQELLGR